MISVADCWSRMLSRLAFVKNDELVSDRTTKRIDEREQDPEPPQPGEAPERRARAWPPRPARRRDVMPRGHAAPARRRTRPRGSRPRSIASPSSSATIRPRRITSTRCARPSTSSSSDEIRTTPRPVGGELGQEVVDRALGADVDAARRLVRDHAPAARTAASARTGPSAGCRPTAPRPAPPKRAPRTSQRVEHRARRRALAPAPDDAGRAERAEPRQRGVLDRPSAGRSGPRPCATRGSSRARRRGCAAGCVRASRAAGERDRPPPDLRRAEDGARELRAPRADEPGDAEDLTRAQVEARRRRRPARRARAPRAATGASAAGGSFTGNVDVERPPEHRLDERVLGLVGRPRRPHQLAVAEHGDRVGELEHLAEEVRDQDDRLARRVRDARTISCSCSVSLRAQRGGRLVHHDQLRVARERAEDLDLLLLGGAQPPGRQRARAGRSPPTSASSA